ncbi:MAG: membrane complex biogenesis BtpA family protein [Limisphaerales bacterium]|jgi:membrane complex biogenesis BtpA family protein
MATRALFNSKKQSLIAMLHLQALPGTPQSNLTVEKIVIRAMEEAAVYVKYGVDILMLENMHDRPYTAGGVGPEITSVMTRVAVSLRTKYPKIPIGVQVLAAANKEALAVALAADLDFIRVEGFVFAHVADEGWINASAAELLRYRKMIKADHIKIFADVKKKHSSHAVTSDLSVEAISSAAEFFLCDGVVLTGHSTGLPADSQELDRIKKSVKIPVLIGSGITPESVNEMGRADGFIVGSYMKKGGKWNNQIDPTRVKAMVKALK